MMQNKNILSKLKSKLKTHKQSLQQDDTKHTVQSLIQKISNITKQNPQFTKSSFYTTYILTMMQKMAQFFEPIVNRLQKQFKQSTLLSYEKQLASIMYSIMTQGQIFYTIIHLWVGFCQFKFKEIIQSNQENLVFCGKQIRKLMHQEYYLLCLYLFKICLFIYNKPFRQIQQFDQKKLFDFLKKQITGCKKMSILHNYLLKYIKAGAENVGLESIEENMDYLDKLCGVRKIPIPFFDCLDLLKKFYREHILTEKIKLGQKLVDTVREDIGKYRVENSMWEQHYIATDDVFSVLAYALWRVNRNIFGACCYIEIILCCDYEEISLENIVAQLEEFGPNARHSYQTIKSISQLGFIAQQFLSLL